VLARRFRASGIFLAGDVQPLDLGDPVLIWIAGGYGDAHMTSDGLALLTISVGLKQRALVMIG
jgi:hypothetical protein